ncbi:MAG: ribonuclease P protein component [Leptospiraceae bacterium]|nr:ribonuclease P protein component [Leptospiraceae bacterium]
MAKRAQYFVSLKSQKRIDELFTKGQKRYGRTLLLRILPNQAHELPPQVVFAVAKKLGPPTVRNRIKRRLREALFTVLKSAQPPMVGVDMALVPRREVADCDFGQLCRELESLLRQKK